jgi:hypothetical protein
MKLIDARKEVLLRLSSRCGFDVPENRLSGETRQQITALASSYRQLFALRDLVKLERENNKRVASKLKREITGKKSLDLSKNLETIETMRGALDKKISEVAARIVTESSWRPPKIVAAASPSVAAPVRPAILEPIRCPSCGADMSMPTSSVTKCRYCGTEYSVSSYLQSLGADLSPTPPPAPPVQQAPPAALTPVTTDSKTSTDSTSATSS